MFDFSQVRLNGGGIFICLREDFGKGIIGWNTSDGGLYWVCETFNDLLYSGCRD